MTEIARSKELSQCWAQSKCPINATEAGSGAHINSERGSCPSHPLSCLSLGCAASALHSPGLPRVSLLLPGPSQGAVVSVPPFLLQRPGGWGGGCTVNSVGFPWEELVGKAAAARKALGKKFRREIHFFSFGRNLTGAELAQVPKPRGKKKSPLPLLLITRLSPRGGFKTKNTLLRRQGTEHCHVAEETGKLCGEGRPGPREGRGQVPVASRPLAAQVVSRWKIPQHSMEASGKTSFPWTGAVGGQERSKASGWASPGTEARSAMPVPSSLRCPLCRNSGGRL